MMHALPVEDGKPAECVPVTRRRMDVQTEWALAVVLQVMSDSALNGLSVRRTQAVIDHLRMAAKCPSISMELSATCDKLCCLWQTIDLQ
jgi:hypothetical protein